MGAGVEEEVGLLLFGSASNGEMCKQASLTRRFCIALSALVNGYSRYGSAFNGGKWEAAMVGFAYGCSTLERPFDREEVISCEAI